MHGVLIAAIIMAGAVVITLLATWLVRSQSRQVTRRAEVRTLRRELDVARETITAVEAHVDKWSDLDSVLAADVRAELRRYREGTRKRVLGEK